MATVHDAPPLATFEQEPWDSAMELLFKEARRRQRRRRSRRLLGALIVVGVVATAVIINLGASGSSSPQSVSSPSALASYSGAKVLTCSGASVVRPRRLMVSCADANTLLTSTYWTTWNAQGATGTTTFAMNLCTPYCAASPMSYFPHSSVRLSAPVSSAHGTHFTRLVVGYLMGTSHKTFVFSWRGGTQR